MMVPLEATADAKHGVLKYSQSGLQSRNLSMRQCRFHHRYREDWSEVKSVAGVGMQVIKVGRIDLL